MNVIILISLAAFASTLIGGLLAFRFQKNTQIILGFSAGAVIGVAFFDLMPTAIELSSKAFGIRQITSVAGLGFIVYMTLDRVVISLNKKSNQNTLTWKGKILAFCLTLHSFLDGVAIGLSFQVSTAIGGVVATAVLIHDFADGINTSNIVFKEKGNKKHALRWILINAIAPLLGACSTFFFRLPLEKLGILIALVSGFFFYIGAVRLLPESQQRKDQMISYLMTILGIVTLYIAVRLSGL